MGDRVVVVGARDDVVPFSDFLVEGLDLVAVILQRVSAQGRCTGGFGEAARRTMAAASFTGSPGS
jgi:hypothetical protein